MMSVWSIHNIGQLLLWVYLTIEAAFCFVFYWYMIPRANRRTTPGAPFHEYGRDRCRLWFRIIDRCAAVAEKKGECPREAIKAFMLSCFAPVVESSSSTSPRATSTSSSSTTTTAAAVTTPSLSTSTAAAPTAAAAPTTTAHYAAPKTPTMITVKSPLSAFLLQEHDDDDDEDDDSISDTEDSTTSSSSSPPRLLRVSRESMSITSSDCGSSGLNETNSCLSLSYYDDSSMFMSPDTSTTTITTNSTTPASTNACLLDLQDDQWTIPQLAQDDVTQLFCWAIFNKPLEQFEEWEHAEVQRTFHKMQDKYGLVFASGGSTGQYKARQLSFEDVQSLYRPLLVYIAVFFVKYILCYSVLRLAGFQKCVSTTHGLVGWYRPARDSKSQPLLPLLFFHGIAPGGVAVYLPMVLAGLAYDGRAVFLFENPNISCQFGFDALTEKQTAAGVVEIVDRFIPQDQGLSLVGHSFGTFTLAWMLKYEQFVDRIQQYVLLDPVSLVLSEPYVLNNFVYRKGLSHTRIVAGSELFTEYYLRRFFHHYNSELWLEELPERVQTIVALSEADEIVNAPKVKEYVQYFGNRASLQMFYWKGVGHAFCVPIPSMWRQIKQTMLQQELKLLQPQQQKQEEQTS